MAVGSTSRGEAHEEGETVKRLLEKRLRPSYWLTPTFVLVHAPAVDTTI